MKQILLLVFIFAGLSFSSRAQSADAMAIKQLNRQWLDAIVHEDSASLARVLADDFVLINPAGKTQNKNR
ncbi:MAG: nuclear transport factor 2 family protein [Puia sp.]